MDILGQSIFCCIIAVFPSLWHLKNKKKVLKNSVLTTINSKIDKAAVPEVVFLQIKCKAAWEIEKKMFACYQIALEIFLDDIPEKNCSLPYLTYVSVSEMLIPSISNVVA